MKTLIIFFALLATFATTRAQEDIHPSVALEFGKPVKVWAEFVAKENSYFEQNLVSEPYTLKVTAVNGRVLKQPVLIEYRLHAGSADRATMERPGSVQTFEAYESLYQPATATPWLAEGEQGEAFTLVHLLHIRPADPASPGRTGSP